MPRFFQRLAFALPLAASALLTTPTPAAADDSVKTTKVWNNTGSTITVYWVAAGCAGTGGGGKVMFVCKTTTLAHGESASYTWAWGQTTKQVTASCAATDELGLYKSWDADSEYTFVSRCSLSAGAPPAAAPPPAAPPPAPIYFKLINKADGLCLDVDGNDGAKDRTIGLWRCEDQLDQTFYLDGKYIRNAKSKLVIDVVGPGNAGDKLILWDADGVADQHWTLGDNWQWRALKNGKNGLCLEATRSAQAQLATCNASSAKQMFMVVEYPH